MGILLELRAKQKDGSITAEELKTLQDLEADMKSEESEADAEAKAIDDMATKLAAATMAKMTPKEEQKSEPKIEVIDHSTKFIVDPEMGRVHVDQLSDVKIELTDRKRAGKSATSVSKKTVHILQAMLSGDRQKLQTLVEGTGARGGFLVPEDFLNVLVEDRRDMTVMRGLATVIPVTTDTVHLPNLASRPKAFWRSEAAVKNTSTVDFGETVLTPYSLATIVSLSNELVSDASLGGSIVSLVSQFMARALSEEEDKQFWTGNGSGKPTGIDNYSFNTISGGITDTTRADALIKAIYALPQGYRSSARFVANKNTLAKIATLKDNNNNYLLSDLGSAASPVIRGIAVVEQNDIADGKVFLGDFSYYWIADRQGITIDTSTEATVASSSAFEKNLTFIRVEERVDGELTLTQPIVELSSMGGL